MQPLFKLIFDMHPFKHFVDFCSSLIVVLTCISLIYKPTRDRIMKFFTNKKAVQNIEADKKELIQRMNQIEAQLKAFDEKSDMRDLSTVTLLHDRLYTACERALKIGKITVYNLDNIEHLFQEYHRLGGNGTGTELYKRVKNLPIVTETWEEDKNEIMDESRGNSGN